MIIPMKKAHLLILKEDQNKVLESLQRYRVFMPINLSDDPLGDNLVEEEYLQRTEETLKLLMKYREGKKTKATLTYDEFTKVNPERKILLEKVAQTKLEIEKLKSENEQLEERITFYLPWQELDVQLNELKNTKYTTLHLGFIHPQNQERVENIIAEYGSVLKIYGESRDGLAIIFINFYQDDKEVYQRIKNLGFVDLEMPDEPKTPRLIIANLEAKLNANNGNIVALEKKLTEYAENINELEVLNDQLLTKLELKKVQGKETLQALYLEGWVRSDQVEEFKTAISSATPIYDLEIRDPKEDEEPPTATKNNRFVEAFESITNLYSPPNYREIDPNPMMAPWYWIIFGMMVGDAGYGLVMILAFGLLINILRPQGDSRKLFKTLQYSGITSILWGVLFGSYFGHTWNPILFVPMEKPVETLLLCLIIGALHIISAILFKAYINIKNKNYLDALFDDFTWVMILVGIGFLFLPPLANVGKALALIGVIVILLTGGRKKKNIFGKLTGGLTSLMGITNYLSDILSYSRILALSLSSAVIAMVMNMLAGMLQASVIGFVFAIVVYLIGHIFNLAMGLLSAYVHDSRLQYIEFYGKFFEGGGYQFKPLSYQLKYINDIDDRI